ncbi:hypothetical protein VKT23_019173 [Stygiomarasmius scandens]|uniref:Uncharacterized protein n=1 Tax=Marasmiellus scandens TaxID=2682957 RepID=A0ABR1IM59_9AGAR
MSLAHFARYICKCFTISAAPQGVQLPRHGGAVNSVTHGNSTTRERMKRRRLDDTSTTSKVEPTAEVSTTLSSTSLRSTTRNGVVYPTDDQVFVGATYDPKLQLDYGGKNFAQVNARLVQPDFRDVHQKLICPWEFYDKLRPRTLVMANVNFAVYVMDGRKIYHANILSLRILGVSDLPVDPPQRPRFGVVTASGPLGDSFKNFVVPNFSPPSPNHQAASSSAVSPPLASGLGEQAGESAQADTSSISPTGSASSGTLDGSDSSVDFNSRMKAIDVSDLTELEGDVDMNGVDGGDYEVVDHRVEQSKSKSRKQKRNH